MWKPSTYIVSDASKLNMRTIKVIYKATSENKEIFFCHIVSVHVLNIITQVSCTVTQSSWRVAQHILSWWQNPPRRMKRNTILFLFIYRLVSRANSILMSDPGNKGCVFQTRKRLYNHKCLLGKPSKQAEKLKSREMKEGWMKNDEGWWRMNEERWNMNDESWRMMIWRCRGVLQTNERTDRHLWL